MSDEVVAPDARAIARNKLAEYVGDFNEGYGHDPMAVVEHIEHTLGWRPPARVIETLAELDACEKGTIVRTVDGSAWNLPTGSAVLIGGKSLPATVLWESGDPR